MINVAVLVNSMANIRPKSVIILIGAVRPGPKYGHARKKTAGYHLFRNVLPECNPILGSQLTAAATQLFSRDVRKRPAYVLCPWRYSGAVAYTRWISITLPLARLATP